VQVFGAPAVRQKLHFKISYLFCAGFKIAQQAAQAFQIVIIAPPLTKVSDMFAAFKIGRPITGH